ncbi:hypothetical protein [Cellulomonas sp.]|uniref:hypothetical protein n=1 Tax=Cellulomonas sp. TaxID=40001 RepID=UPI003BABC0DE
MGDAILRTADADFSTSERDRGWRALVEWCLSLDAAVRVLTAGATRARLADPNNDEFVEVGRDGEHLVLADSRTASHGRVLEDEFTALARDFIRRSVEWIGEVYPAAKRNPSARSYWERLDVYLGD